MAIGDRIRASASWRALAVPNFRRFFAGELVSMVGGWMHSIAQSWLVLQLSGSGTSLGIVVALQNLPILILGVWGGVVADRVDNRKLLVCTETFAALQAALLGVITVTGHVTVAWLYAFALLLGVANVFQFPAVNALLFELVDDRELPSAIGLNSVVMSVGRLAGPALGAIVIALFGIAACFFVNAGTYVFAALTLVLLKVGALRPRRAAAGTRVSMRDGLAYVWRHPRLRVALVAVTVVGMLAVNFAVVVPAMVKFEFDAGASAFAWVQAIGGLGSLVGGLVAASVVHPRLRSLGLHGVVFGGLLLASAAAPSIAVFAALWLGVGLTSAMFMALDQMVLQHGAAPEYQGRVMSLYTMAWMGTTPVGALIVGASIEVSSARLGVVIGAVATLATGVWVLGCAVRHSDASGPGAGTAAVPHVAAGQAG